MTDDTELFPLQPDWEGGSGKDAGPFSSEFARADEDPEGSDRGDPRGEDSDRRRSSVPAESSTTDPDESDPDGSDSDRSGPAEFDPAVEATSTPSDSRPNGGPSRQRSRRLDPGPMGSEGMQTDLSRPVSLDGEGWDDANSRLRDHFPTATEGVLFCIYKVLQDRETSLRDFRDEAATRGIALSGRSMHSAKVMLGLAEPATRRSKQAEPAGPTSTPEVAQPTSAARANASSRTPPPGAERASRGNRPKPSSGTEGFGDSTAVEQALRNAVAQMQDAAQAETNRLRDAILEAIEVLRRAVDEN